MRTRTGSQAEVMGCTNKTGFHLALTMCIVPLLYQVYLIKGHDLLSYFLLSEKLRKCFILLPVHCRLKCLGGLSFGFEKIKFKMADSKIGHFSKSPILNIFCENFMERSLG